MTATTALLLITLAAQGHWFGGQPATVEVQWVLPDRAAEAVLVWQLSYAGNPLATGREAVNAADATFTITPPEVRVRTAMRLTYQLHIADGEAVLERGERTVHVYPDNLLEGAADRQRVPLVVVGEEEDALPALLRAAGVKHRLVANPTALQLTPAPMIVLVPQREMPLEPAAQQMLHDLAKRGASVMVFEHRKQKDPQWMGEAMRSRPAPDRLIWLADHPLHRHFTATDLHSWLADLHSWLADVDADLFAVELPADAAATAVAAWPVPMQSRQPGPRHAAVMVRNIAGQGRLVLWQLPVGPWQTDPRSQQLLINALDYLGTPAEPTPAPTAVPDKPLTDSTRTGRATSLAHSGERMP